jgi:hypothetical protein
VEGDIVEEGGRLEEGDTDERLEGVSDGRLEGDSDGRLEGKPDGDTYGGLDGKPDGTNKLFLSSILGTSNLKQRTETIV